MLHFAALLACNFLLVSAQYGYSYGGPQQQPLAPAPIAIVRPLIPAPPAAQPLLQPQAPLQPRAPLQPQAPLQPRAPLQPQPMITAPSLPIPVHAVPTTESPTPILDCKDRPDGVYVLNQNHCSKGFWKCVNDQAYEYKCPAGLYFGIEDMRCEYKKNVPACGGVRPPPPPPTNLVPTTPAAPIDFSCQGKLDGYYYKQPCANTFYSCAAGNAVKLSCPPGTGYDPNDQACEYNTVCGKPKPPPPSPVSVAQPLRQAPLIPAAPLSSLPTPFYGAPAAPVAVAQLPPPAPLSALPTPFYGAPAAPVAVAPTPAYGYNAPPVAVAPPQPAPAYNAPPPPVAVEPTPSYSAPAPVAVAPAQPSYYSAPAQQAPAPIAVAPVTPAPVTPAPVDFDCSGKLDGYYAKQACTSTFYSCSGGHATQLSCPQGTGYDLNDQTCEYSQVCGQPKPPPPSAAPINVAPAPAPAYGAPPTAPINVAPQASYGSAPIQPAPINIEPTTRAPVDFSCAGNIDGYYFKQPCTSTFYSCSGGHATQLTCPPGTAYDPVDKACEYNQVCGKPKPPPPSAAPINVAPIPGYGAPVQPAPIAVAPAPTTPTPVDYNCQGKQDGYYFKQACAPEFYSCAGGTAYKFSCPAGTGYDESVQSCDYLAICGKPRPTTPAPTPAPAPIAVAPQQPQAPAYAPAAPVAVEPQAPAYSAPAYSAPAPVAVAPTEPPAPAYNYNTAAPLPPPAPIAVEPITPAPINNQYRY